MSDQNPIHRDRGKRDQGAEPYQDAKETFGQKEANLERNASIPGDEGDGLTSEQRDELMKQSASERLAKVQQDMDNDEKS
jgi:hypothetical protein